MKFFEICLPRKLVTSKLLRAWGLESTLLSYYLLVMFTNISNVYFDIVSLIVEFPCVLSSPLPPEPLCADDACLNRITNYECGAKTCPAGDRCRNQRFEKKLYAPSEVVPMIRQTLNG
jgi:hypothetical protein